MLSSRERGLNSLTHSRTHSLTHSLTHPLINSLTHSPYSAALSHSRTRALRSCTYDIISPRGIASLECYFFLYFHRLHNAALTSPRTLVHSVTRSLDRALASWLFSLTHSRLCAPSFTHACACLVAVLTQPPTHACALSHLLARVHSSCASIVCSHYSIFYNAALSHSLTHSRVRFTHALATFSRLVRLPRVCSPRELASFANYLSMPHSITH